MEDERIIELLFERNEKGLSLITEKYSDLYKSILRRALGDEGEVEECANDCLLAIWSSIPPNRPEKLSAYVCRLARNIGIRRFKSRTAKKRSGNIEALSDELLEALPDDSVRAPFEDGEISDIISDFLSEADKITRVLFVRRYFYLESNEELSKRFGISKNLLAVKLSRARAKLKKKLEKEGISI